MATFVLKDASVVYNSVDLSAWVKSVSVSQAATLQDDTAMGDDDESAVGGLKNWSVSITFNQDFAAGAVDATLSGVGIGGSATMVIKPTSAAVSATNPSYTGTAFLESYPPVDGNVGDLAGAQASFKGSGALTRATS